MTFKNPLEETIQLYFAESFEIISLASKLEHHLRDYQKVLHERFTKSKVRLAQDVVENKFPLIVSSLIIEDISNPKGLRYPTNTVDRLHFENLNRHIQETIAIEQYTLLFRSVEVFKKYLFDIVAVYIYNFQKVTHFQNYTTIDEIKQELHSKKFKSKSDKKVFELIKEISPIYQKIETSNNWNTNLYDWYYCLVEIRNGVVHSFPDILSITNFNKLSPERKKIFTNIFKCVLDQHSLKINIEVHPVQIRMLYGKLS